jgi:hypothetical protein
MIKITYMILGIISLITVVGTLPISSHVFALDIGNLTSSSLTTNPTATSSQPSTTALQNDIQGLVSSVTTQAKAQALQQQAQSLQTDAQGLGSSSIQDQMLSHSSQTNNPLTASGVQTPQSHLQTPQNTSSIFGQ